MRGDIDNAERMAMNVLNELQHPYALHILGLVRHFQQRTAEGIRLLEKACEIGGEQAENCLHRAKMYVRLHEDDPIAAPDGPLRAEALLRRAIELDPVSTEPRCDLAELLNRMGCAREGVSFLDPMLDHSPAPAGVLASFAELAPRLGRGREAVSRIETVLEGANHPPRAELKLWAALANLLDREGEYDQAFLAMRKSNEIQYAGVEPPDFCGFVDEIIATFEPAFRLPKADGRSNLPVYIVGLPRSGTSLVEEIIGAHSQAHPGGEIKVINKVVDELPEITGGAHFPEAVNRLDARTLGKIGRSQAAYLSKLGPGARRVTNKMPVNFLFLGLISMIQPDARIIHCRRNPLDACLSMYFKPWDIQRYYIKTLESLADFCNGYDRIMRHWRDVLDLQIFDVDYETLVAEPETTARAMIEFLDLDWEDVCLNFYEGDRFIHTSSYEQVRQPIYDRSIGRWRNYAHHLAPLRERLGKIPLEGASR